MAVWLGHLADEPIVAASRSSAFAGTRLSRPRYSGLRGCRRGPRSAPRRRISPAAAVISSSSRPAGSDTSSAAPSKARSGTARNRPARRQRARRRRAPAGDAHAPDRDLGHHGFGGGARDGEHRQAGRMVGALHERQPGDDLGRARRIRAPSTRGRRRRPASAGTRPRSPFDSETASTTPAAPICGTKGTVKPKWKRAESRISRVARREIGMHRERRLHIGEGGDDDPPDAFGGVERQDAVMALRPGGASSPPRAPGGRRSRISCASLTAISRSMISPRSHQQAVHGLVDAVDLLAQVGERGGLWPSVALLVVSGMARPHSAYGCRAGRKQRKH